MEGITWVAGRFITHFCMKCMNLLCYVEVLSICLPAGLVFKTSEVDVSEVWYLWVIHSVVFYDRYIGSSKWVLHRVWSVASSFNFQYPVTSLRSSSSCWCLHPCLPVTSILPSTYPSMCFRKFLCKMWPIQSAFLIFIVCMIFLSSLTLCNTSPFLRQSVQLIFSHLLQHHI